MWNEAIFNKVVFVAPLLIHILAGLVAFVSSRLAADSELIGVFRGCDRWRG